MASERAQYPKGIGRRRPCPCVRQGCPWLKGAMGWSHEEAMAHFGDIDFDSPAEAGLVWSWNAAWATENALLCELSRYDFFGTGQVKRDLLVKLVSMVAPTITPNMIDKFIDDIAGAYAHEIPYRSFVKSVFRPHTDAESDDHDLSLPPMKELLPDSFMIALSIIASGNVKFLSVDWLKRQPETWRVLRCQDLPTEAFLKPRHAAQLFQSNEGLAATSYRWLTESHPDPDAFHFKTLHLLLTKGEYRTQGLFWDYPSLPQRDANGERTAHEQAVFDNGLQSLTFIYGSPTVLILQLKELPKKSSLTPYQKSGWCTFEQLASYICKPSDYTADLSVFGAKAVLQQALEESLDGCVNTLFRQSSSTLRGPPMHPDRARKVIMSKTFTNQADPAKVSELYRAFFFSVCKDVTKLDLKHQSPDHIAGIGWGWRDREGKVLADALPEFVKCEELLLDDHALGDKCLGRIADAIAKMPNLKVFQNRGTRGYGEDGLHAFAKRIPEMQHLTSCILHGRFDDDMDGGLMSPDAEHVLREELIGEWRRCGNKGKLEFMC